MSSFKRFQIILTAILVAAPTLLASCGQEATDNTETTTTASGDSQTTAVEEYQYPYPDEGFGGEEFNILNTNDMWTMHSVIDREEATGDALDDAIYNRNTLIEDKLGITIVETLTDNDYLYGTLLNVARNSILSGSDEYDVMYIPTHVSSGMVSENAFVNLLDVESIQLDREWWYQKYNDAITINDGLFGAFGGSNIMIQDAVRVLAFNQNMLDDLKLDAPYDLVREGKWTLDKLNEYMTAGAQLNGADSAVWDKNASTVYGLINSGNGMTNFLYGCGEFNVENQDGILTNTCGTDRWFNVIDKITTLFTLNDAKFLNAHNGDDRDPELGGYVYMFMNQRALFSVSEVNKFQSFRSLDFDFGVVPFPKYDEEQDSYYATAYEGATGAFIPVTSSDPEKVGLILDAMSYEGEKSVVPTFRNIAVESKGLRNDDSVEMLGIIMDNVVPCIGKIFTLDNTLQDALDLDIINKTNTAASIYASNKESIDAKIADVMEEWNK